MEETEQETHICGLVSAQELEEGQRIPVLFDYAVNAVWYKGRLKSLKLDDLDKMGDDEFKDIVYWAITVLSKRYFCQHEECQSGDAIFKFFGVDSKKDYERIIAENDK